MLEHVIPPCFGNPALYIWCFWAGQAAVHVGNYEAALDWLLRAREANRAYANPLPWLAVAYLGLGRETDGRAVMAQFRAERNFSLARWNEGHPRRHPVVAEQRARIEVMLRKLIEDTQKVTSGR